MISLTFAVALATPIGMQDTKSKTSHPKTYNHLQTSSKPFHYYHHHHHQQPQHLQPQQQQQFYYQPQYVPVHVLAKAAYIPQHPQQIPTMIIITPQATPTYPAPVQQLLNYFHSNPQARQQFLYGGQTGGPAYVVAAPAPQYYTPAPSPAPAQYYYAPQPEQQQQQPVQLQQLADVAQQTAQRFYGGGQIKPIVTGLENFTPEQQAQIKARINDVIIQDQQQQHHQQQQQPGAVMMADFVPSPEVKGEEGGVAYVEQQQAYTTKG